jgi:hypothetical protein
LLDDDIRTAGHIKRALKKYVVAGFEFVDGNDGTSLDEITLVAGWILHRRKRA